MTTMSRRIPWGRILEILTLLGLAAHLAGCASTGTPGEGQPPAPARALLFFYGEGLNHLSSVRSGACPMHPSCSSYSRKAFGKHGLVVGWWMTFDRLLRCDPDEVERGTPILVRGAWKAYDPVSRNDRWWHDPPEAPPPPLRTP
jgi:putative component of membrane protein insertase Oxa1/YidC/SpoIIIJ protein YidD